MPGYGEKCVVMCRCDSFRTPLKTFTVVLSGLGEWFESSLARSFTDVKNIIGR
jgi:hypothetical protein